MKPRLKSSPAARELIKRFEPLRKTAERGPDGRWVVGYGHRAAARGGIAVGEEEASLLLIYDVMQAEQAIDDMTSAPLSRGQRDALISFVHDIGLDAFRSSDVARYLFEGRMEAAGEALAAHGDGLSERREAESRLFLDSLLPAKVKSRPIELVIKVEHPAEERVLEGAIAGGPPPAPAEDFPPPPPPMPDRAITSRREAEAEIARILATVEAMPLEERESLAAEDAVSSIETAVSERRNDPIEGQYSAVEDAPAVADDASETQAVTEDIAEDTPAEQVMARMTQELDPDADADAEILPEAVAEAETLESEAPEESVTPPMAEDADAAEPRPVAPAFDVPAGMGLGFVLTRAEPTVETEPVVDTDEADADAQTAPVIDAAETAPVASAAVAQEYALELPKGTGLGYAFTTVMAGRFRPDPSTIAYQPPQSEPEPQDKPAASMPVEAEPVAEAPVDEVVEDVAAAVDPQAVEADQDAEATDIEPVAEAVADDTDPAADETSDEAVTEIVERAVAVAGDGTPPPHPAERPAEAPGAVGEVAGEPVEAQAETAEPVVDPEDPMMDGADPLTEDEFSPQDLAADVHPSQDKPVRQSDDGIWGFLSIFIAGSVVAGYGAAVTYDDWGRMLSQRDLSIDGWATIGGVFLMLASAWPMVSAIAGRLKGNRRKSA
jgi:GH24 family phage-related lysozyme (muramidase)